MTESEIQFLKDNIDKVVEIHTFNGEHLVAEVLFVMHSDEYDEHDVTYKVISSNMLGSYSNLESSGGYVLDFEEIETVRPHVL